MTFIDLQIPSGILQALEESGFEQPTPIQSKAIPKILSGFDLRASAQTGTGKTAAFLIPALMRLTAPSSKGKNGPRILILAPTRELAMQIASESIKFSKHMERVKTVCLYGGTPYPAQIKDLKGFYEILVATPGRLIDHMERGRIDFSRVEMLILDEADRMLDMGFIEPVEQIAAALPKNRQTLMFSATLKGSVMKLSEKLLKNPMELSVTPADNKHDNIEQRLHFVDNIEHKHQLLGHLLEDPTINQAIVFTSTKMAADQLVDKLYDDGFSAAALHGDMNQRQRSNTIKQLRMGKINILVATDVAARGIDVQTISHVINFDLPQSGEDYIHRIGRTGRAGAKGIAFSFASPKDFTMLRRIEELLGKRIAAHVVPGLEPKMRQPSQKPSPQNRRFPPKKRGRFGFQSRELGSRSKG